MGTNIVKRQNDLFLGEDWKVIYDTFKNVNFKTYSFDSIKISLINYIRENYPEQFNDWSENSEFIILLDTLAYLGESLSFRVDLNSRDNFIDTAERRESILRLAKMLSYQPRRNKAANGKVKIRSIKTSQIVRDSEGRNLQNRPIIWNDPQNPDWQEQFILVMNSAFNSTNPFGRPSKQVNIRDKVIQLYQMNTPNTNKVAKEFSSIVAGENMDFEIINADFDEFGNFTELHPNQENPFNIIYQNDGSGNTSPNTGFFLAFKQGSLDFENLLFNNAIENRVYEYSVQNINEDDVWLSEIDEQGKEIAKWEKVPSLESIVYNDIDNEVRKIFAVQTGDNDTISLRFSDGKFGEVPKGIFRIWARESNGLEYTINPQEIRSKNITVKYKKNTGTDQDSRYDLTITFDLFDTVRNSATRETNEQIKERAPRTYYTQNRMTNAEDYNSFPLSIGSNIKKIKSVNRVYSGQSPFFDNYDPTRRFSSTINFGDDGIIYKEDFTQTRFEVLPTNKTPSQIATNIIIPLLQNINLTSFYLDRNKAIDIDDLIWRQSSATPTTSEGGISEQPNTPLLTFLPNSPFPRNRFINGGYILFQEPLTGDEPTTYIPKQKWANIVSIGPNGIDFTIDENIPNLWVIKKIIVNIRQFFAPNEFSLITQQIDNNNTFGLRYNIETRSWVIIDELNVSSENSIYSTAFEGDDSNLSRDASWLIRVQFTNNEYRAVSRNLRYIFESEDVVRFFFDESDKGINRNTALISNSRITILGINEDLSTGKMLKKDYTFKVIEPVRFSDGYIESRKVEIKPFDSDLDGTFDIPDSFDIVTNITDNTITKDTIVIYKKNIDPYGYEEFIPQDKILIENTLQLLSFYDWINNPEGYVAGLAFNSKIFYVYNSDNEKLEESQDFNIKQGRKKLNFKYSHFSPEDRRIDPSVTNVIDSYVLTENYFKQVIDWKSTDKSSTFPTGELSTVLQDEFSGLDRFKMISDQIVWNNAKFTLLFGDGALPENRAIFKVVKVENTDLTDNQIKQGIINAIDEYFDLDNWDFGDIIYTSELVAYIHKKMLTSIAFITILPKSANDIRKRPEEMFQIRQEFNALPLSIATVSDIIISTTASPEITV